MEIPGNVVLTVETNAVRWNTVPGGLHPKSDFPLVSGKTGLPGVEPILASPCPYYYKEPQ